MLCQPVTRRSASVHSSSRPSRLESLRPRHAVAASLRAATPARTAGTLACRRRFFSGQTEEKVVSPAIGQDHAGEHDEHERQPCPEADDVVPVEVASFARKTPPEPRHVPHLRPGPLPRHPEIETGDDEDQEPEIASAGDRAADGPVLLARSQPAVPSRDGAKERPHPRRAFAENLATVGIQVERVLPPQADRGGRCGIGLHRQARRSSARPRRQHRGEQGLRREPRSAGRGRGRAVAAVGPVGDLPLVHQQHAGRRHDEDHAPYTEACGEVKPEDDLAEPSVHGSGARTAGAR